MAEVTIEEHPVYVGGVPALLVLEWQSTDFDAAMQLGPDEDAAPVIISRGDIRTGAWLDFNGIRIPFTGELAFNGLEPGSGRPVYSGTIQMQAR